MKTQIKKILHLALLALWLIPVLCQAQGIELTTGGSIACTASATIEINNGSFINNGTYTKGSETVTFSGNTAKTISGTSVSDFYNLTLTNSGGISITENAKVTVSHTLANSVGDAGLVLKSTASGTASLIESTASIGATVERYFTGAAEAWHLLSSPVASQAISGDFTPAGTYTGGFGYDFYAWAEPSQTWLNQKEPANSSIFTSFIPGKGYLVAYQAANPIKSFAGDLNTGSYNFPMTVSATGTYEHSNLAGNPYPSSIDWKAATGLNKENVVVESGGGHNLYIWNQTANNYGAYNDNNSGDNGTNSVTRYIPPMQGFFVVASAAGNLVIDNAAREHSAQSFLKSAEESFRLSVTAPVNYGSDEVLLDFGHPSSAGGAEKWESFIPTAPGIYTPKDGNNFSISFLTSVSDNPVVPVNFKAGANGSYSLNALFNSSAFTTANLEDKQTGIIYDLRLNPLYTFDAFTADDENRFNLHFTTVGINETEAEAAPLIYAYEKTVYISTKVTSGAEVFVRNITGQLIKKTSISGTTSAIELSALPVGVYVVNVADAQGIYSAKVILK